MYVNWDFVNCNPWYDTLREEALQTSDLSQLSKESKARIKGIVTDHISQIRYNLRKDQIPGFSEEQRRYRILNGFTVPSILFGLIILLIAPVLVMTDFEAYHTAIVATGIGGVALLLLGTVTCCVSNPLFRRLANEAIWIRLCMDVSENGETSMRTFSAQEVDWTLFAQSDFSELRELSALGWRKMHAEPLAADEDARLTVGIETILRERRSEVAQNMSLEQHAFARQYRGIHRLQRKGWISLPFFVGCILLIPMLGDDGVFVLVNAVMYTVLLVSGLGTVVLLPLAVAIGGTLRKKLRRMLVQQRLVEYVRRAEERSGVTDVQPS